LPYGRQTPGEAGPEREQTAPRWGTIQVGIDVPPALVAFQAPYQGWFRAVRYEPAARYYRVAQRSQQAVVNTAAPAHSSRPACRNLRNRWCPAQGQSRIEHTNKGISGRRNRRNAAPGRPGYCTADRGNSVAYSLKTTVYPIIPHGRRKSICRLNRAVDNIRFETYNFLRSLDAD